MSGVWGEAGAVALGLASALAWGGGDFSGGAASRRANVYGIVIIAHGIGLALLAALALLAGEALPSWQDAAWGFIAGLAGAVGLVALYRALALGRMGTVSPVSAVLATAFPVLFAALTEGLPGAAQVAGFGLAVIGVWLVSTTPGAAARPDGLELALLAGLGFGAFFILIDRTSGDSVYGTLCAARIASLLLMAGIVLARREPWRPSRRLLPLIVLSGLLDVGGNAFFLLAAHAGRLDVAAVLASLYPAVTVLLAWIALHEHLTRRQLAGLAIALAAITLIAA